MSYLIYRPYVRIVMLARQEARQDTLQNTSDANKQNRIVFAGGVNRLYQRTLGLKMDIVRRVRVQQEPLHA